MSYNPPFGDELPLVFDSAYTAPNGNELAFNFYNGPLPDPVLARSDMAVPLDVVAAAATTVRGASHPLLSFSFTVGVTAQVSCAGQVTANLTLSATASGGTEVRGAAGTDLHLTIAAIGGSRVSGTASCSFNLATSGSGFSTVIGAGAPQIAPSFNAAGIARTQAVAAFNVPISTSIIAGTTVFGDVPVYFFNGNALVGMIIKQVVSAGGVAVNSANGSVHMSFSAHGDGVAAVFGAASMPLPIWASGASCVEVRGQVDIDTPLGVSASGAGCVSGLGAVPILYPVRAGVSGWANLLILRVDGHVVNVGCADFQLISPNLSGAKTNLTTYFHGEGFSGVVGSVELDMSSALFFPADVGIGRTGLATATIPFEFSGQATAYVPPAVAASSLMTPLVVAGVGATIVVGTGDVIVRVSMTSTAGSTVSAIATPRIAPIVTGVAAVTVSGGSEAVVPLKVSAAAALDATGVCAATLRTGVAANGITLSPVSGQAEAELQMHVVAAGVRGTQGAVDVGAWIGVSGGGATCRIGEGFAALDFSVAAHGLRGASGVTEFPYLGVTATGVVASVFSGAALVHPQFSVAAGTDRAGGYLRGAFVKIETQQAVAHG